jgi:hypothetical protein
MNQSLTTLDTDYLMPYGVRVLSASSCKFSSSSAENSNEAQYTSSLSSEVSAKGSLSASAGGTYGGVSGKISGELAFSKSESFKSFSQGSSKFQTVTFDAKAVCTEFDLSQGKRVMIDDDLLRAYAVRFAASTRF